MELCRLKDNSATSTRAFRHNASDIRFKTIHNKSTRPFFSDKYTFSSALKSGQTAWLDLRGNHDTFDVPFETHPNNFYRRFSIRGGNVSSYSHHVMLDGGDKYSFIATDFTPSPGPKRPFK